MNIRMIVENEKQNIEKSIAEKEILIGKLPEGSIQVHQSGSAYNWFHRTKKNIAKDNQNKQSTNELKIERKYIPKNDRSLAEKLAYKGYLQSQLYDERANLRAANSFLRYYKANDHAEKYLKENAGRCELLMPSLHNSDKEIEAWLRDVYTGEVPEKQNLRYMSQAGFKVRSKSEQIIVALLVKYQVPFKYEQHLYINGSNLYPDFMIMHPKTHKVYVWEHLGMMDSYQYRSHNFDKINNYCVLGFMPGDNLILTYETVESGLDEILIEKLIQHYF